MPKGKGEHHPVPWTTGELDVVREMVPRVGVKGCMGHLQGRTYASIASKAWELHVRNPHGNHVWTPEEDQRLITFIGGYAERAGLTEKKVAGRVAALYAYGVFDGDV